MAIWFPDPGDNLYTIFTTDNIKDSAPHQSYRPTFLKRPSPRNMLLSLSRTPCPFERDLSAGGRLLIGASVAGTHTLFPHRVSQQSAVCHRSTGARSSILSTTTSTWDAATMRPWRLSHTLFARQDASRHFDMAALQSVDSLSSSGAASTT
jgi:hypothetical protein